jgi:deoxycytidine triphosphate deaminase
VEIHPYSPIAQVIFHVLSSPVRHGYEGKYQNQANRPVGAIDE